MRVRTHYDSPYSFGMTYLLLVYHVSLNIKYYDGAIYSIQKDKSKQIPLGLNHICYIYINKYYCRLA
jgi:hypothetical protein